MKTTPNPTPITQNTVSHEPCARISAWNGLPYLFLAALLKLARRRRASASPASLEPVAKRLPVITRDMIQPHDKVLTRYDVAEAYRDFYIEHFAPEYGHEVEMAYEEVLNGIEYQIKAMEYERDELMPRLKQARYDLHEARRGLTKAVTDDDKAGCHARVAEADATLARRQARFDAADARIAAFKADLRGYFVNFLNEKIHEHNHQRS